LPPPEDYVYTSFAFIFAAFTFLALWTLFSFCTIYYGKNQVNELTFRPFKWAALTLALKVLALLITMIELPFFACIIKQCG
jgi:hypothetical protein